MLLAESTAGSVALGGLGFLGVSVVALAGALVWFPFVAQHPPKEARSASSTGGS
jgi:hypothetical protein